MVERKISTKDVLKVVGISGIVVASAVIPGLPMALGATIKLWKNVNKKDLGRIIKRLEKQKMVLLKEKGNKISIEITDKGKRRVLEYDFENIDIKNKRRDGNFRLVIFDIPEQRKSAREVFRRKLLQLGLIRLQDSVFASAFPCKQEIDFLCHYLGISDYITVVSVDKIERGEKLIFKKYYTGDNE